MSRFVLTDATIVTGASSMKGALGVEDGRITGIWENDPPGEAEGYVTVPLGGKVLMAGGIDAHVHFREPGMTHKADIGSESLAAVTGGITSFIDMPNTVPPTVSLEALALKASRAAGRSLANYGFHLGATDGNAASIEDCIALSGDLFGGIKVFMGSSTGNLLVKDEETLERLFRIKGKPVLVHSEDETAIKAGLDEALQKFGKDIPFRAHPMIRSRRACILSTAKALSMAIADGTRLHLLHVSTAEEVEMVRAAKIHNPLITAETSANYLWFCDEDYDRLGPWIKCNPSIKGAGDRAALRKGLADGIIDTIGSDHAPHLEEEKRKPYPECPSGIPSIQFSLPVLLTVAREEGIPLTRIAEVFSETPARIFGIEDRGFLKPGCFADLVVIDPDEEWTVQGTVSKCGWTPYEGVRLHGAVKMVWVNGIPVLPGCRPTSGTGLCPGQPLRFQAIG